MTNFPEILTAARFYLELHLAGSDDRVDGVFRDCSGFRASQTVIEIAEVTPATWGKAGKARGQIARTKIPGNLTQPNLTLRRGLTISTAFWDWLEDVAAGHWSAQRRDGSLTIYDQAATGRFRLEFSRAWPVSYEIADVSVTGADYEIETIELAVEALRRVPLAGQASTVTANGAGGGA